MERKRSHLWELQNGSNGSKASFSLHGNSLDKAPQAPPPMPQQMPDDGSVAEGLNMNKTAVEKKVPKS